MADNVSFKVVLRNQGKGVEPEIRRFVVDKNESTSFSSLKEKFCVVFPHLKKKNFSLTVAVSSQEDNKNDKNPPQFLFPGFFHGNPYGCGMDRFGGMGVGMGQMGGMGHMEGMGQMGRLG